MAIKTYRIRLSPTRRALYAPKRSVNEAYGRRDSNGYVYSVTLRSDVNFYVGGSDVTASNGWFVQAGETATFELYWGESVYGVTSSGTGVVQVLRGGV